MTFELNCQTQGGDYIIHFAVRQSEDQGGRVCHRKFWTDGINPSTLARAHGPLDSNSSIISCTYVAEHQSMRQIVFTLGGLDLGSYVQ